MAKRNAISRADRERITSMPCAVCGATWGIEVDHVIPESIGGIDDETNLQPLCRVCNRIKSNRLSNEQIALRLREMGKARFLHDSYLFLRRRSALSPHCVPSFDAWFVRHPLEWAHVFKVASQFFDAEE